METLNRLEADLRGQAAKIILDVTTESGHLLRELAAGADPYQVLTQLHLLLLRIRREADAAQWGYIRELFEFPEEAAS